MQIIDRINTYRTSSGTNSREFIAIHDTGTPGGTALNHADHFSKPDSDSSAPKNTSCHFWVDEHDKVYQTTATDRIAWHVGKPKSGAKASNSSCIGIEMCIDNSGNLLDKTVENTLKLTKTLMEKYNIPASNVIRHYDVSGKGCPNTMSSNNWAKWHDFKKRLGDTSSGDFMTGLEEGTSENSSSGTSLPKREPMQDVEVDFNTTFEFDDFYIGNHRFNVDSDFREASPDLNTMASRFFSFPQSQEEERRFYENDVPMPHRENLSFYTLRLGDTVLTIPPTSITINTATNTNRVVGIRQSSSLKDQTGFANRTLMIPIWFNTLDDINGYPIEGPEGTYYVDGLRSLIAQFRRTPFLPIENEFVNDVNGIYNVSLVSLNFSTVPEFPHCIQAELILKEFNIEPFIQTHPFEYRNMIDWDVFRWYYQELLKETSDSDVYLRPLTPQGARDIKNFEIEILDLESITKDSDIDEAYKTIERYIMEEYEEEAVKFKELEFSVTSISASMSNLMNEVNLTAHRTPASQYMGFSDIILNLDIQTTDREFVRRINFIKDYCDRISRENQDKNLFGFCRIKNELFQLTGVEQVFLDGITVSTMEGVPGGFHVQMAMISFDPTQKKKESLYAFRPFKAGSSDVHPNNSPQVITQDATGLKRKIRQDNYAEQELQNINFYPDLELPTVERLNVFLKKLKEFRAKHGIKGGLQHFKLPGNPAYVDPDFYMIYKSFSADDYVTMMEPTTRDAIMDLFLAEDLNLTESTLTDEELVAILSTDASNDKFVPKLQTFAMGREVVSKWTLEANTEKVPANINTLKAERMCVDMFYQSMRGRLLKAFPTYLTVFIDEPSDWLDGRKMWNNYYVCHSVLELDVHNSVRSPNATATVTLSNAFNIVNDIHWKDQLPNQLEDVRKKYDFGSPNLTSAMLENHHKLLRTIRLSAGTRIHIRMGYGNNIHRMAIALNGTITQVNHGLVTTLVAQSDGVELINSVMDADEEDINSTFNYGGEPSNAIGNIMTERTNWVLNKVNSAWGEASKYGIEHFGINMNGKVTPGQYGDTVQEQMFSSPKKIFFNALTFTTTPARALYIVGRNVADEVTDNDPPESEEEVGEESEEDDDRGDSEEERTPKKGELHHGRINNFLSSAAEGIRKSVFSDKAIMDMMDTEGNPVGMSWWKEYDITKNIHLANEETVSRLSDHQGLSNTIARNISDAKKIADGEYSMFEGAQAIVSRNFDFLGFDGEENVSFFLHNKTPWDVFQNMKSIVPDFICHPHYFQFESTLFFGDPTWNVKFRNSLGDTETPDGLTDVDGDMFNKPRTSMGTRSHYFVDRENFVAEKYQESLNFTVYEHSKPYSQFHYIGEADIIDNQVTANGDAIVATNCQPIYTIDRDNPTTGKTVYSDSGIRSSLQKTKVIDTNFVSNIPLVPGVAEDFVRGVGSVLGVTPTKDKARKMSVNYLMQSMSEMYQDGIIILGKAEIKPHDIIFIKDDFVGMGGLAEVREVVHSMSAEGFTTTVYPKLCTFAADGGGDKYATYMNLTKMASALSMTDLLRDNVFYASGVEEMLKDMAQKNVKLNAARTAGHLSTAALGITAAKTLPMFVTGAKIGVATVKGLMAPKTLSAVWKTIKTVKTVKGAFAAVKSGMTIVAAASSPTIIGPAIVAIVMVALNILVSGIIEYFENRNVLKALPLFYKEKPFTAGVSGYKNLIPGFVDDEPTDITSKVAEGGSVRLPENDSVMNYVMANQIGNRSKVEETLNKHNDYVFNHKYPFMQNDSLYAKVGKPSESSRTGATEYSS